MHQYIHALFSDILGPMFTSGKLSVLPTIEISIPDLAFGDYATNVALRLAGQLKQSPQEIAEKFAVELTARDSAGRFESITAVGGFINFKVSKKFLGEFVYELVSDIAIEPIGKQKKVVFEYSSPNTNKPLHIGHTRNDTYGVACVNLLKAVGYDVTTCEIINDRGVHIMKSMLMYQRFGNGETPESTGLKPDHFVGKFYALFGQQAAESPEIEAVLLEEAQELLRKWEAGDSEVRALWKQMNDWFFEGVKETYAREGSNFDEVDFESDIFDKGKELVLDGVKRGVFTQEEDGSVSVDLTAQGLDKKYLLRKDGTTIYITQDLYLWHIRNDRHHPDSAFVTTSIEQSYHFKVLQELFKILEFPWANTFQHLPYEHVYLGEGKMSSRTGKSITADDLLDTIKERIKTVMGGLEKTKQLATNDELVEQVAFGAIKYGYLKYEPNTRIYFDIEQTISLEGNTGPYIQYAYARMRSIITKAGEFEQVMAVSLTDPAEIDLARNLLHYSEQIVHAATEHKPNILCNYLYELASTFGTFYAAVPVLKTDDLALRNERLTLILATANILQHGLNILGIQAPEEM